MWGTVNALTSFYIICMENFISFFVNQVSIDQTLLNQTTLQNTVQTFKSNMVQGQMLPEYY